MPRGSWAAWAAWAAWVALAGRVGAATPWAFRDAGRAGVVQRAGVFQTGSCAAVSGAKVAGITAPEKLHVAPANGRPPVARASESRGNAPRTYRA